MLEDDTQKINMKLERVKWNHDKLFHT